MGSLEWKEQINYVGALYIKLAKQLIALENKHKFYVIINTFTASK